MALTLQRTDFQWRISKLSRSRRTIAATITVALIVASIIAFGIVLALRQPPEHETRAVDFLHNSVRVYRNDFGIPHIIAADDEDAFVALGYVHARDRLWQMDLLRRIARGQLSEIFGPTFVKTDAFFRTLGLARVAESTLLTALSPQSHRILRAYSAGVNAFIAAHQRELPFEFGALNYKPQPWTEADCLAIGRLMAFDLSMSFWVDIVLGEIAERHGVEFALRLVPEDSPNEPRVLKSVKTATPATPLQQSIGQSNAELRQLYHSVAAAWIHARQQAGLHSCGGGSNSWAITSPMTHQTVLANDPHLALSLPPRWYQVHITSPSYNVVGLTIPGLPAVLVGRNSAIAWGVTNVMLDDCDYFIELPDTVRSNAVVVGSRSIRLSTRIDTITVRGGVRHIIAIRSVQGRPIISDAHLTAEDDTVINFPPLRSGTPLARRYMLSLAWTGYYPSDEIAALARIMRAQSWSDFRQALILWGAPALNFTYADVRGNVGIQPAGLVPRRRLGHPNLPLPGWDTAYHWRGALRTPFPAIYNPPSAFVASANNKTADTLPFFVSHLWEPSSRAERITELLQLLPRYSVRDAQLMQLDVYSPYAKSLLLRVLPVLESMSLSPTERKALALLREWDYTLLPNSAAAAVYSVFLHRLMEECFSTHLASDEFQRYAFVPSMPLRRVQQILQDPTQWFHPDSATAAQQCRSAIERAFRRAVTFLEQRFRTSPEQWRWGEVHRLELKHPLAVISAYRPLLTRSFTTIGGDATTLANGLWKVHEPFDMFIGASMRFVTCLQDTVAYAVLPGGISGNPLSAHFTDQLVLWANGGLLQLPIAPYPQKGWELATLLLPTSRKSR